MSAADKGILVAVFAERDQEWHAVAAGLAGAACLRYSKWTEFEQSFPMAELAVVVLPFLDRHEYSGLVTLRAAHPLVPTILITSHGAENLIRLKAAIFEDVVFVQMIHRDIARAARSVLEGRCLERAARLIETLQLPDTLLVAALVRACRQPLPPRTVIELAVLAGWTRRTLYRRWRNACGANLRPHDFLRWLLLIHAVRLRLRRGSWLAAARELGTDRRTLDTCALRLLGGRLSGATRLGCGAWLAGLRQIITGA